MEQHAEHTQTTREKRLRAPAHRVSPRARSLWLVHAVFGWTVLLVLEVLALLFSWFGLPGWVWPTTVAVTVVVGIAHAVLMPLVRYRVHRWETTADAVYTQSGWLDIEWRIVPISRIQTVDTKRDVLQRLFGLSSVTVTTASAAGAVEIKQLDHEVATALSDELTAHAAMIEGDAT